MLKKKDISIIVVLLSLAITLIFSWTLSRETFKIGQSFVFIDDRNKIITVNLDGNSDTRQFLSFNFPSKNDNIYIKPISYGATIAVDSVEQKLTNNSIYDFKDFIFHGKIIIKSGKQSTEYDLFVTEDKIPILQVDSSDQNGNTQKIPEVENGDTRLTCKLNIISSDKAIQQANVDIEIKTLGNTSTNEKETYSFNIKEKAIKEFTPEILDFKDEKRFKLNPLNNDPSLMRIKLSYDIFNMLSDENHRDIAPDSEFVEVFIDNEYKGLYLIEERINRQLFDLSNYDKKDFEHSVLYEAESMLADFTNGIQGFSQKEPDPVQDKPYMEPLSQLADFINGNSKENFDNKVDDIIDLNNAIDSQILFLLTCNQDTTALNQFIYRNNSINADNKFRFCPGDLYSSSFGRESDSIILKSYKSFIGNTLFDRLYENVSYYEAFKARWNELRERIITYDGIAKMIDENAAEIIQAQERNFKANPFIAFDYESQEIEFEGEINYMKNFINKRLLWLDEKINNPPSITIGSTEVKIYEDHNTIFCALPLGSDPLQTIKYKFGPDAKVYIEPESYGTTSIYNTYFYYSDFDGYEKLLSNENKTDKNIIFIDKPTPGTVINDTIQIIGWALNPEVKNDIDIENIFVFNGPLISKETFLGKAKIGIPRQDVSDHFNNPFYMNSGFQLGINTHSLKNGIHGLHIYAFNKNGKYSVKVLTLEIFNQANIEGISEPMRIQIKNGQKFDFEDYIFHGNLIVEESGQSTVYDLWITTGSLPIICVSTDTSELNLTSKIDGEIKVIDNSNCLQRNIGIKTRGWTADTFSKKHYSFEIRDDYGNPKNIDLLGLPEENDWILAGPRIDKSLIRNSIAFKLSNEIGLYAPRTRFAELFIADDNESGKYRGVYCLTEKIKVDKNRVDITKVSEVDVNYPENSKYVTGDFSGFILQISENPKNRPEDLLIITDRGTVLRIDYPNKTEIDKYQIEWITDYINKFESVLYSDNFNNSVSGYSKYVDMGSLVDYIIINELFRNYDTFTYSTIMSIDIDGKIKFGPVWDFDFSSGNLPTEPFYNSPEGWTYLSRYWTDRFFADDDFKNMLNKRWKELRTSALSDRNIENIIKLYTGELSDSHIRNFLKWDILEKEDDSGPDLYADEIERLEKWLLKRTKWLDENFIFCGF